MAAIFAKALCKPCEWMAEGCTQCCNAMTKACGAMCGCCDQMCASIGKCCDSMCAAIGACCTRCCDGLEQCFSKPFSGVVFITVLMSIVPFAALFYFMTNWWGAPGCDKPLHIWLLVTLVLFLLNLVFAGYLYSRLASQDFENPELNPKYNPQAHEEVNQYEHASHFFLYDGGVCLFMLLGLFEFSWAIVGFVWAGGAEQSCSIQSSSLVTAVTAGAIILMCFIAIFTLGVICSVYSGFITVCMDDCNCFKCICCLCYYPLFYSHNKAREQYHRSHAVLGGPRQQAAAPLRPAAQGGPVVYNPMAHAVGGPVRQQQPPQQYGGNVVPQPNQGGAVYYQPRSQQQAAPQYQQAPVNYQQQNGAHQYQQQVNYAPHPQNYNPNQSLLGPQQHAPYQPPPQQFSPVRQQQPQLEGQVEGVPNNPPGGAGVSPVPVAQPLAQPIARAPQEKSGVAKAADGARAAAASVSNWWKK